MRSLPEHMDCMALRIACHIESGCRPLHMASGMSRRVSHCGRLPCTDGCNSRKAYRTSPCTACGLAPRSNLDTDNKESCLYSVSMSQKLRTTFRQCIGAPEGVQGIVKLTGMPTLQSATTWNSTRVALRIDVHMAFHLDGVLAIHDFSLYLDCAFDSVLGLKLPAE